MASISSNRDAVVKGLFGLSQAFNLRRRLAGSKRLGDEIIEAAAASIQERTINRQQQPDGKPLAPLKPRYLRAKLRAGYPATIGVRTGEMLDFQQITGRVIVTDVAAEMAAGIDNETQNKVAWFIEGSKVRRPRPYYELDKDGEAAVDAVCVEARDQAIREAEQA